MKRFVSILATALMSTVCLSSASFAETFECQEGTNALINPLDYKLSCIPQNIVNELKKEINAITGECPEAMVAMINAESYDRVCLPKTLVMSHVASSHPQRQTSDASQPQNAASVPAESTTPANAQTQLTTPATPAQPGTQANAQTQSNPQTTTSETSNAAVEPAATTHTPVPVVLIPNQASNLTAEDTEYREFMMRDDDIASAITKGGVSLTYGMGYGMLAAIDFRIEAGYQFQYIGDSHAGFGLYAAVNLRTGFPIFSMDAAIVPKLHVSKDNFRFSLGFGLGLFYVSEPDWFEEYNDSDEESSEFPMWFQIRPELDFDWFLSKNAWLGFGFDMPLVVSAGHPLYMGTDSTLEIWFDLFIHVGYKF